LALAQQRRRKAWLHSVAKESLSARHLPYKKSKQSILAILWQPAEEILHWYTTTTYHCFNLRDECERVLTDIEFRIR